MEVVRTLAEHDLALGRATEPNVPFPPCPCPCFAPAAETGCPIRPRSSPLPDCGCCNRWEKVTDKLKEMGPGGGVGLGCGMGLGMGLVGTVGAGAQMGLRYARSSCPSLTSIWAWDQGSQEGIAFIHLQVGKQRKP